MNPNLNIVEAALAYHSSSSIQSIEKAAAANTPTTLHPQPAPYQHENVLSTSEADPVLTLRWHRHVQITEIHCMR